LAQASGSISSDLFLTSRNVIHTSPMYRSRHCSSEDLLSFLLLFAFGANLCWLGRGEAYFAKSVAAVAASMIVLVYGVHRLLRLLRSWRSPNSARAPRFGSAPWLLSRRSQWASEIQTLHPSDARVQEKLRHGAPKQERFWSGCGEKHGADKPDHVDWLWRKPAQHFLKGLHTLSRRAETPVNQPPIATGVNIPIINDIAVDWGAAELEVNQDDLDALRVAFAHRYPQRQLPSEADLRRLLVASNGHVVASLNHIERMEQAIQDARVTLSDPIVTDIREVGLFFRLKGSDRAGRPVLVFNGKAHDAKRFPPKAVAALVLSVMEEALADLPVGKIKMLLIAYLPIGTPVDVSMSRQVVSLMSTAFPERLDRCLICPCGASTPWIYKLVRPFLPAATQRKLVFVAPGNWKTTEAQAILQSYIAPEVLPRVLGGLNPWWPNEDCDISDWPEVGR